MQIKESDIVYVENFVKKELEDRIKERCDQLGTVLEENEKEFLFGMYASSIDEFKFLQGERYQILGAAEVLQNQFAEKGVEEFNKMFEVPKGFKIDKRGTCEFSFGWFYGVKLHKSVHASVFDQSEMQSQLLPKLTQFFQSFKLQPMQPIGDHTITLVDLGARGLRADVLCVFCPEKAEDPTSQKKHAIQLDKTGRWNFSNFRKHIKIHTQKAVNESIYGCSSPDAKPIKQELMHSSNNIPIEKQTEATAVTIDADIMSMPIVVDEFGLSFEHEPAMTTNEALYEQFSKQNLRMVEAMLRNKENNRYMVLQIGDQPVNVDIVKMKSDGNCVFSTLSHQLTCVKANSDALNVGTSNLRAQVVSHMQNNFDDFKQALKMRLECTDEEIDTLGPTFISEKLSQNGYWGDSESLMAVSKIFKVNILVFQENASCYFATGYNRSYGRTIFMAYRGNGSGSQNEYVHYDSVCGISEDVLYKCANELSTKMDKMPNPDVAWETM